MPLVFDSNLGSTHQVPNVTSHTTNPGVTNDVNSGYQPGDLWLNTATGVSWTCQVNTAGAAVWSETSNGSSLAKYATSLVAVGSTRADALVLTARMNRVITAASSAVGVTLPGSALVGVGNSVRVYNDGPANAFHVYAAGSDTIDGTAGSTGVSLTNAFYCDYLLNAAGAFISVRVAFTRST